MAVVDCRRRETEDLGRTLDVMRCGGRLRQMRLTIGNKARRIRHDIVYKFWGPYLCLSKAEQGVSEPASVGRGCNCRFKLTLYTRDCDALAANNDTTDYVIH